MEQGFRPTAPPVAPAPAAPAAPARLAFLDALRGFALIMMVLNHTARWWLDGSMGWGRYHLAWVTVTLARCRRRGLEIVLAGYLLNLLVFPDLPLTTGTVLHTIGLGIVVAGPLLWVLHHRPLRLALLGVAALLVGLVAGAAWLRLRTRFRSRRPLALAGPRATPG